ncbi:MAG: Gfo/Idh/MocA family oxidoreductase [Halioglobus sp.]
MNIAIVGCGGIAEIHAQSIRSLGHTVTVAVGRTLGSAKAFSKRWDVARYSDVLSEELMRDVDCVHICTPPGSHYELIERCLRLKKHVICEKPLCLSKDQSRELMHLANSMGLVNAVNFNVRYYDACRQAKELIRQNSFGRSLLVQCSYQQEFHALPADYSWRYKPEQAGYLRATTEIGSHCIDLIRNWTGLEITSLSANFGCFDPIRHLGKDVMHREPVEGSIPINVSSEDAAIISLGFDNGAIGSILLSEIAHGRNNCIKLEVTGESQSVWWDSEIPYHLNVAKKGTGINTSVNAFSQNFSDTVTLFIGQVYDNIMSGSGQNSYPDFRDGFINALICDAIYESAQNNAQWVQVEAY